ncbi:MAG TPA: hypothetical protein VE961_02650 [Pyrinomonadaceae bacterium]|nr:hypothetical protein [Pyrinomonadaceae bacterium]
MLRVHAVKSLIVCATSLLLFSTAIAQKENKQPTGPLITRTTTRHENYRLPFGGTVTVVGAPAGSLTIEAWQKSEIDITASIELQGPNAAALDQLAVLNTFAVDVDVDHIRILTTGTHDREFMKRVAKNFPKNLIGLPWKLNLQIKLPALTDLEIDAGVGPINLSGVEGTLRLNALKSDANLSLTGGLAAVLIQEGSINLNIPGHSWHGLGAEIRMAAGTVNVGFAPDFSIDVDADVLRAGEIQIGLPNLKPREGASIAKNSVRARNGNGGATLSLTLGDGIIRLRQLEKF